MHYFPTLDCDTIVMSSVSVFILPLFVCSFDYEHCGYEGTALEKVHVHDMHPCIHASTHLINVRTIFVLTFV